MNFERDREKEGVGWGKEPMNTNNNGKYQSIVNKH